MSAPVRLDEVLEPRNDLIITNIMIGLSSY